jgi:hypothetical protein
MQKFLKETATAATFISLTLGLIAFFNPATASAEPMYLLKSDNIKRAAEDSARIQKVGFDEKGNLTVRSGNMSVVLICNPPGSENEHLSGKPPVIMAMSHELPEITGVGVKISLAF